jgi:hypothetical protein
MVRIHFPPPASPSSPVPSRATCLEPRLPCMGRRVIEILADSANNRNDSPMETAGDEVTSSGSRSTDWRALPQPLGTADRL